MLVNHHDIDQNISFIGKFFFLLVICSYLYWKQLSQRTSNIFVHLLLFHLIAEDFVNQIWNHYISNKFQGLLLYTTLLEKEFHQIYRNMKRKPWMIGEKIYYLIKTQTTLCIYKTRGIGSLLLINKQIMKNPMTRLKGVLSKNRPRPCNIAY